MSDDEEYYEWEEEYLFEEVVPDLAVSAHPKHLLISEANLIFFR